MELNKTGENKYEVVHVRTKRGAMFTGSKTPVHAAFIVVSSPDEKSFYLNSLMWLVQVSETPDFKKCWMKAKDGKELRKLVLEEYQKHCGEGVGWFRDGELRARV